MLDHEHPQPTKRHQYRYLFTAKHHGGVKGAAHWILSEPDEFAVFDDADERELSDDDGNLYGALRDEYGSLQFLGTFQEQIAEFPCQTEDMPWHGYPIWAINQDGPSSVRNAKRRPTTVVFDKMVAVGLITSKMRARLMKGDHV